MQTVGLHQQEASVAAVEVVAAVAEVVEAAAAVVEVAAAVVLSPLEQFRQWLDLRKGVAELLVAVEKPKLKANPVIQPWHPCNQVLAHLGMSLGSVGCAILVDAPPNRTALQSSTALHCLAAIASTAATAATLATAPTAAMASPTVLTFDAEGCAVDFNVWVDDLQLFLQCDSRDGVSLFDHMSGASTAPAATADSTV
ncbi:unnamed protein product [Closterium sp. NIES-53]